MPELPDSIRERFISEYGLPQYDAGLFLDSRSMARYFEECVKILTGCSSKEELLKRIKLTANWILGDFNRMLNVTNTTIENVKVTPRHLVDMINLIDKGIISGPVAKAIFEEMFTTGKTANDIVDEKGLMQISDGAAIENIVVQVIANSSQAVADFKAGKQQSITFLVGQIMKATKGRANPALANKILMEKLGGK